MEVLGGGGGGVWGGGGVTGTLRGGKTFNIEM